MKLKVLLPIVLLLPISAAYAETQVSVDSQQICENRINGYKSGLEASIKAKRNVDEAKAELDQINKLPNTLSPCDKQKRIAALSNTDETSKQANEALKDKQISPANDK
ncbi:MAG: hypothetical protein EOO68_09485 [Moraxellaceae bacterium]|nr:MAG: hypothetical protein EOO68_09485 [Moraxellaceae bacterium]